MIINVAFPHSRRKRQYTMLNPGETRAERSMLIVPQSFSSEARPDTLHDLIGKLLSDRDVSVSDERGRLAVGADLSGYDGIDFDRPVELHIVEDYTRSRNGLIYRHIRQVRTVPTVAAGRADIETRDGTITLPERLRLSPEQHEVFTRMHRLDLAAEGGGRTHLYGHTIEYR